MMKKNALTCIVFVTLLVQTYGQKRMLAYNFEFEKSFLAKSDYDAYFLDGKNDENFAFILKDNKKADYVLVDKAFKVSSKFTVPVEQTVFDLNGETYLGGTAQNNVFNYVYKVVDKKTFSKDKIYYQLETVDFNSKSVSNKILFEIPKEESLLISFSDNNKYFTITANDKTSELIFYTMNENGEPLRKSLPFKVPEGKSRKKNEITEYMEGIKLVKEKEEAGLDIAIKSAKIFSLPNKLVFTMNDGDDPTHLFTVDITNFSYKENFIDHASLFSKEEKGKSYVSSFFADEKLFALILNKKNIRVAIYDLPSGNISKTHEVNDESSFGMFAYQPVYEERRGSKAKEKEYEEIKPLIKAFTKGTEGLTVTKNKTGQYVITAGTYDMIQLSSGSSGGWVGGFQRAAPVAGSIAAPVMVWNSSLYYRPGFSGYSRTSARYYYTSYFKLLLDPKTLNVARGRVPVTTGDQIKDYLETIDKKAKATNQFMLGENQYYGYYNRDAMAYTVEQITIRK